MGLIRLKINPKIQTLNANRTQPQVQIQGYLTQIEP